MNLLSCFLFFINRPHSGKNNRNGPGELHWYTSHPHEKLNSLSSVIVSMGVTLLGELIHITLFVRPSNIGNIKNNDNRTVDSIALNIDNILLLL